MQISRETANKKLALRLLRDCIYGVGSRYVLFSLVIMAAAAVGLAPPQLYRLFFQSIEADGDGPVKKVLAFGSIIALCTLVATALSMYAREWLRCEIESSLRKKVLNALTLTSLQRLESVNRGEWIACTSGDLIQTEDFLTLSFPDQVKNLLMFIGTCALFLYYGGILGFILLLLAVGLVFLNVTIQNKMRPTLNEIRDLHGEVYQQLLESFEGLRTIRSFGGETMVSGNFSQKLDIINKKSLNNMRYFAALIGTNELIILLGVTGVLGIILFKLQANTLSFDDALIYPFYMSIFFSSVASFYRSNFDWTMFFIKGARLAKLIYDFGNSEKILKDDVVVSSYDTSSTQLSFSNIELKYAGHPALVPAFDLELNKAKVLGIIGPSGCGKSTLLEFLAGLRPLKVGDTFTQLSTSLSSYVEQKPYIFEGAISDNLRFGCNIESSDEQLWAALEKTRLADFFHKKSGLRFRVQERGQNLSEGEKYRIGIARALLANKPFLLMDEPFAALDHLSIRAIVDLICLERKHRGIVLVTHYLPAELIFDEIVDFQILSKAHKSKRRAKLLLAT